MTLLGWIVVAAGAVVVGVVAQLIEGLRVPYQWVITGVAGFVGAVASSEWLYPNWTPAWEGIALWPALIGGLVVAVVVDLIERYLAGMSGSQPTGYGTPAR